MGETLSASLLIRGVGLLGVVLVLARRREARRVSLGFGALALAFYILLATFESFVLGNEPYPREEYAQSAAILNMVAFVPSFGLALLTFDRSPEVEGWRWVPRVVFGALAFAVLASIGLHVRFSGG